MDSNQTDVKYYDPIAFLAGPFNGISPPHRNPFGLLKFYGTKFKRLAAELPTVQSYDLLYNDHSSSAVLVMESSKDRVHEMISKNADALSILANSLRYFPGLPSFVFNDIEISILLQAAAAKVAAQKFTCAKKLVRFCMHSSCKKGTPVQRLVYYFSETLQSRIDLIEIPSSHDCYAMQQDVIQSRYSLHPAVMDRPQEFKNIQETSQFAGIQSILDGVGSAIRIHIIDLGIKNGSQWTLLMQALSQRKIRPIRHLRITAIGTSEEMLIETGKRLWSFADTLNISFSFGIIISELKDIKIDFFEIESNETVAVYSSMSLFSLVAWIVDLESLVRVLRSLRPRVMVVHELHASTNSIGFLERFEGTLSYFSILFDFLSILGTDHPYRNLMEGTYYRIMLRNILTAEGTKRIQRHEKIDFWRALFERCGFVETSVGSSALCQVKLLQTSPTFFNSSSTMDLNGKSLILGWKGNPMEFVSTWKLHR